jgi:deazaflavin-dependent oxidoreductase (nitroreductase family)
VPLSRSIARLNRVGLNRVTRHLAPHLPGFGVIEHRGRKSGRLYRTPINVFGTGTGYLIALTYGTDTDWIRNLRAAGEAVLITRGRRVTIVDPRLHQDTTRRGIPRVPRAILGLFRIDDFLTVTVATDDHHQESGDAGRR